MECHQVSYPHPFGQCCSPPSIDATSQLRSYLDFGGLTVIGAKSRLMLHRYWYCNTEKDLLSGLYLHDQVPQIRLIRGSGTRYVAVVVPLAKLGLTKCTVVRGASEASDRNDRDSR